jgi:hypothetical protein
VPGIFAGLIMIFEVNDGGYMKCKYVDHPEIEFHYYDATDEASTQKKHILSSKRRPYFQTYKWSRNEHKLSHGS